MVSITFLLFPFNFEALKGVLLNCIQMGVVGSPNNKHTAIFTYLSGVEYLRPAYRYGIYATPELIRG
jgi:hypothetical protein